MVRKPVDVLRHRWQFAAISALHLLQFQKLSQQHWPVYGLDLGQILLDPGARPRLPGRLELVSLLVDSP